MDPARGQPLARVAPWILAALVLAGSLLATLLYRQHAAHLEQAALEGRFTNDANRIIANLGQQLGHYEVVMRGLQGFYRGSDRIEYDEFLRYNSALEATAELTGVQGVAFVKAVQASELPALNARLNRELPVPFQVHPSGERSFYAPITLIDPLTEANRRAVGYDILTNPSAREAALLARDTGEIVITPPISLVQDASDPVGPSFVMYLPVYESGADTDSVEQRRSALRGWIDVPFRMADLIAGLAGLIPENIRLRIRDPAAPAGNREMFNAASGDHSSGALSPGELQQIREIPIGNRRWEVRMSTTPEYRSGLLLPRRSTLISLAGIAVSVLLAAVVLNIAAGRNRSERRAARLSHLYQALSEVNQAIVRMESEKELFPLVCNMAVHYGNLKMAWVGHITPSGAVEPAASAGVGTHYLDSLAQKNYRPGQSSPTAEAIRENRPVIVNDYLKDERTRQWRDRALRYGWRSCAIFPVPRNGQPFAVLIVYQGRPNAFDEDVVSLLREMAEDVTFALDNFDRETQRREYQHALAESEQRLSTVIENVGACIFLKDRQGRYTFANRQVLQLFECEESDLLGADDEPFFAASALQQIRDNDRRVLEHGETLQKEEVVRIKSGGTLRTFWSVKLPLCRADGSIYGLCGIATDITDRKAQEEQLRYLSNYDALTGLPNREMLRERTRLALSAAAEQGEPLALLCINLDRFKLINDSLGHHVGDQVLQTLSQRMTGDLHLNATLSRLGSDDFILLLPSTGIDQARDAARRLQQVIAAPIALDHHRLVITASIGVASYPQHGDNFDQLIQSADAALFRAKQKGPDHCEVFTQLIGVDVNESLRIENDLREALTRNQFVLHYQPQVEIHTGAITGVEALLRWQHPVHGLVPPGQFIPVAEKTGLIIDIGHWVLETAVRQQTAWRSKGLPIESVAVNLSISQLYSDRLLETIDELLAALDVPPGSLELELTESIAMEHSSRTLETLQQLQARGISLAIDDFGTGYSSLSYLKRYPVQKIKIDRSFVDGVANDPEDQAIVLAILGVARALGFHTIAEGVETTEQLDFLRNQGCTSYQGHLFSRPVPAEAITRILKNAVGST